MLLGLLEMRTLFMIFEALETFLSHASMSRGLIGLGTAAITQWKGTLSSRANNYNTAACLEQYSSIVRKLASS